MSDEREIINEFLIESHENLDQLDREFVALESDPTARERIASIFRTVHTIKGTAGFLGFHRLEALTHAGEHLLTRLRDGKLALSAEVTSELLRMVDVVRNMLTLIETTGIDGAEAHADLVSRLGQLATQGSLPNAPAPLAAASSAPFQPAAARARAPSQPPAKVVAQPTPPAPSRNIPPPCALTDHDGLAATRITYTNAESLAPSSGGRAATDGSAPPDVHAGASEASVRVDVGLLDRLMNLVGELVLARNQILQHAGGSRDASFQSTTQRLNIITTELQEGVMKTRMQPIGNVWRKFPRIVRDLALICKKQVQVEMLGEDTELDRTIIEAIKDPLTHLVRNAIDHGIEAPELRLARGKPASGRLFLRAFHEGGQVNIEISDDGAGIDAERIRHVAVQRGLMSTEQARSFTDREIVNVIFAPGFSTAEKVTNVSGRGVGMDVVKTNIEKIGGTVDIQSRPGHSTTVKIKIPLTLAIIPALVVTSGGERFAIPQVSLLELVRLEGSQIKTQIENIRGAPVYRLRGCLLPLVYLSRALKMQEPKGDDVEVLNIVVVRAGERQFGLVVEGINDTEEIVVKPLGRELKGISAFAGATIMGDGRVALILDVLGLAQGARVISEVQDRGIRERDDHAAREADERKPLLLFRVNSRGCMAMPLSLVARLEEFDPSTIEHACGCSVVQYRGEILPLIDLRVADAKRAAVASGNERLQVIVYVERGRSVGLIVEQIIDIVEEDVSIKHRSSARGVLEVAVIQGRVTEFLDVEAAVRDAHPELAATDSAA